MIEDEEAKDYDYKKRQKGVDSYTQFLVAMSLCTM